MENRIQIFEIEIDNLSMEETIQKINLSIQKKEPLMHIVVNAAKIANMQKDKELLESIKNADLINADGMAVVWASKLLGTPLKERVAGIDLFCNLVKNASKQQQTVYLLGATEEIVKKVAEKFNQEFGKNIVTGYHNGYFDETDELNIVQEIVNSKATFLFVAMSSPKKEIFLSKYKKQLSSVGFIMGVGGSFDVMAGKVKRAPYWMQRIGIEWFYRFLQEPKRMWKRSFIDNGKFIGLVFKERFKRQ